MPHAASTVKGARAPGYSPPALLGDLHRTHGRQLLGLALRMTDGHRADAEEILQGAYERALIAPERYLADLRSRFTVWSTLCAITERRNQVPARTESPRARCDADSRRRPARGS